ncbi:MAG: tandem-95 repeat protein, partial [Alphaproteobacteria bacterium]|nr:tandem-95 repeat protein [Alphaproteobacteria bacterium]
TSTSLTVSVNDGGASGGAAQTGSSSATIAITAIYDAPSGADHAANLAEATTFTFTPASFSSGFTDPDGNAFAGIRIGSLPASVDGVLKIGSTAAAIGDVVTAAQLSSGALTFVANDHIVGDTTSFGFQVIDNGGTANGGIDTDPSANQFTIHFVPADFPPVAQDDAYSVVEDNARTVAAAQGVLVNDSDPDSASFHAVLVAGPGHAASFTLNADGSFAYTPAADFDGTDSFTYAANDGILDGNVATVTINVAGVNDAPVNHLPGGTATGAEDAGVTFGTAGGNAISISDVDAGSGAVTVDLSVGHGTLTLAGIAGVTAAGNGSAAIHVSGTVAAINAALNGLVYAPAANFNGNDVLSIATSDNGHSGMGAPGGPNLLVNGSFETQDGSNDSLAYIQAAPGDYSGIQWRLASTVYGWQTTTGTEFELDTAGSNPNFHAGAGNVALDMETSPGLNFELYQDVAGLSAGAQYHLTLSAAQGTGGSFGANPTAVMEVLWNGSVIGTINSTSTVMSDWSFNVVAAASGSGSGGANRLEFREIGGGSDARGTILDNVSLAAAGSLSDSDTQAIHINAVNDAPTVIGNPLITLAAIDEDLPSAAGQLIYDLVASHYSDAADQQSAFGGSSPGAFTGILVTANGSSAGTGQWQYYDGSAWVDVGTVSDAQAKLFPYQTAIRFHPAADYNGAAPALTAHLVDNSLGFGLTNALVVDGSVTGGSSAYSAATIGFGETIQAVNDAPVIDLNGAAAGSSVAIGFVENDAATLIAPSATVVDVDSADLAGGALSVSFTSGGTADDRLQILATADISTLGLTISYQGVAIGSFAGGTNGTTPLVVTLNASATPAAVEALARAIAFANASDSPSGADRHVSFTVSDGDGGTSLAATA